jgi:DNA-binding protein YbaB
VSFGNQVEDLIAQTKQMMRQAEEVMRELRERSVEGVAAGGRVTAVADVSGGLREIHVHPRAVRLLDNRSLGDAIAAAVQDAEDNAARARDEALDRLTLGGKSIRQIFAEGPDLSAMRPPTA